MARKLNAQRPAKLGTVYPARARCYDENGTCIGRCIDTPNGVAKAMMEQPAISMAKGQFGGYYFRAQMASRMNEHNDATSEYAPVPVLGSLLG